MFNRTCPECSTPFTTKTRQVTCSKVCAKARHDKQLKEHSAKRKETAPLPQRACGICGKQFQPKTEKHVYCSYGCGQAGLKRASEAQAKRRKEERLKEVAGATRNEGACQTGTGVRTMQGPSNPLPASQHSATEAQEKES